MKTVVFPRGRAPLGPIFTVRNEVAKVMFLHLSVRWCYPSMHCRWYPSMPCRGCLLLGDLLPGRGCACSRGACSWGGGWVCSGGVPAPGGSCLETPPESRRLLLRTVRILLECILVLIFVQFRGKMAKTVVWRPHL